MNGELRTAFPADALYPPPPPLGIFSAAPATAPTLAGGNGGAGAAAAAPFSFRSSPLPWLIVGGGAALLALKFIHWG